MNHTARRRALLVGCIGAVLALVTTACSGQTATVDSGSGGDSGGKKTVRIAAVAGWDEDTAATYLWKQILEDKGYKVDVQELDIASAFTGVANQQIDLYLDAWLPATHAPYWKKLGPKLEKVGAWYSPADLNLTVPTYVKDVNTIADLKAHASEFGGQIVGIEAGSGLMRLTRENVIPDYGLKDYQLTESSTSAMLSALQTAINKKKPIVVTLWRPHWAYAKLPLKVLKDTKGAYGKPDSAEIVASKGFSGDHPELAGWLKNFKLTSDQLGSLELLIQKKGQGHEQEAAKEWMGQNKAVVDAWMK